MKTRFLSLSALAVLFAISTQAQVGSSLERGLKPFGSFQGGNVDTVSMTNGNMHRRRELRPMESTDATSARAKEQARAEAKRIKALFESTLRLRREEEEERRKKEAEKKERKGK
jgi:hypothetical protein